MASTYSTSLRLELMATGDQSGTWGTTTNTNLGTLLEQAITGVLSVAEGDTTLTLTTVNGGSDQARNAVVNLTGAMTAGRNVVVPTANKLYLIKNSTTGGFAVTVKTAAGTGVAVASGTSRWVYCDGTNVVEGGFVALGGDTMTGTLINTGSTVGYLAFQGVSTEAAAAVGPLAELFRDSASPAVNDQLGQVLFTGRSSTAVKRTYAAIQTSVVSPTNAAENSTLDFYTQRAGTLTLGFSMGNGVYPFGVIRTQVFTANGTYTPNANMVYCFIEAQGGGAGGGGTAAAGASQGNSGGGGGGGSYSSLVASKATIGASQTVTVGAVANGGAAGNNNGTAGNDTSVGVLCIGKGGSAGSGSAAGAGGTGGAGGVAGTGDYSVPGERGGDGTATSIVTGEPPTSGKGGSSTKGFGGQAIAVANPTAVVRSGSNYGGGGAGGSSYASSGSAAGGNGASGVAIITEYCSA